MLLDECPICGSELCANVIFYQVGITARVGDDELIPTTKIRSREVPDDVAVYCASGHNHEQILTAVEV